MIISSPIKPITRRHQLCLAISWGQRGESLIYIPTLFWGPQVGRSVKFLLILTYWKRPSKEMAGHSRLTSSEGIFEHRLNQQKTRSLLNPLNIDEQGNGGHRQGDEEEILIERNEPAHANNKSDTSSTADKNISRKV